MNNPVEYMGYNKRQWRDNLICLEENIHKMNWRRSDRVIDIGSGDGSFTAHGLKKFLPEDVVQITGIDMSPAMVRHAFVNFADERINFTVLDIRKDLPKEMIGHFDHAFSFYALHWVFDQNGDCMLSILGSIPAFFDVNHIFARSEKWGRWVEDLENVVSPYHGCLDPEGRVQNLLKTAGFKHIEVKRKKCDYTYESIDDFKKSVKAVTAFKIPSDMFEEYLEEYVETALREGFVDPDLRIQYDLINVYCNKLIVK